MGARHSSLHTTLSVLEGILEYRRNGYRYRLEDLLAAARDSTEFILQHRLYKSDRTGEIIKPAFTRMPWPSRWYFDILRAMDYFRDAAEPYDVRMQDALDLILKKRNPERTWNLQSRYPGAIHFEMEKAGKPSRWNTLRVLRVLRHFKIDTNDANIHRPAERN
jgi:hypothetical protein